MERIKFKNSYGYKGIVDSIFVKHKDFVKVGQPLAIISTQIQKFKIISDIDGIINTIYIFKDDLVDNNQPIFDILTEKDINKIIETKNKKYEDLISDLVANKTLEEWGIVGETKTMKFNIENNQLVHSDIPTSKKTIDFSEDETIDLFNEVIETPQYIDELADFTTHSILEGLESLDNQLNSDSKFDVHNLNDSYLTEENATEEIDELFNNLIQSSNKEIAVDKAPDKSTMVESVDILSNDYNNQNIDEDRIWSKIRNLDQIVREVSLSSRNLNYSSFSFELPLNRVIQLFKKTKSNYLNNFYGNIAVILVFVLLNIIKKMNSQHLDGKISVSQKDNDKIKYVTLNYNDDWNLERLASNLIPKDKNKINLLSEPKNIVIYNFFEEKMDDSSIGLKNNADLIICFNKILYINKNYSAKISLKFNGNKFSIEDILKLKALLIYNLEKIEL